MHRHILALALLVLSVPVWPQTEPAPDALGNPKGSFESWTCESAIGWTCDPSDFNQAIEARFFADGAPSTGTPIGTVIAGRTRGTAVAGQCGNRTNHGFLFPTPDTLKDGKPHTLDAYGVNIGPGRNRLLTGSPKTLTCQPAVTVNVASPRYPGAKAGDQFLLTYRWDGTGTSKPYKVFVHFIDAAGTIAFRDDHIPTPATDRWNGPVSYSRPVTVPATAFGNYTIAVGLFDPVSGERLDLKAGAGVSAQAASRYRIGTLVVGSTFGFEDAGGIEVVRPVTARCEDDDIPDLTPRAFRDADGKVNLISSHFITRRMVGTSLNDLTLDCRPVYQSVENSAFDDFRYREWMASTYTVDGRNISALIHNEWYPCCGLNCKPVPSVTRWANAITLVVSNDKGANYTHPQDYIVVRPPAWTFPCAPETPIVYGAFAPSNIIKKGQHFYALYQSERDPAGNLPSAATCLMRTSSLTTGSAWEIWTGGTTWRNEDTAIPKPLDGIGKIHESVTFNKHLNKYVLVGMNWDPQHAVYVSVSADLMTWEPPVVMKPAPDDNSDFIYTAFLDPTDTSLNFENTGQTPYMYWVRKVGGVNLNRELVRRKIRFIIPAR